MASNKLNYKKKYIRELSKLRNSDTYLDSPFELGKAYRHSAGNEMYVCGMADTFLYGNGLVAENGGTNKIENYSIIDGRTIEATVGWTEITKEEFFNNNYSD